MISKSETFILPHSLSSQSLGSVASQPVCSEAKCHDNKDHVSAQVTEKAESIIKDPESLQSYTSSCHIPPEKPLLTMTSTMDYFIH